MKNILIFILILSFPVFLCSAENAFHVSVSYGTDASSMAYITWKSPENISNGSVMLMDRSGKTETVKAELQKYATKTTVYSIFTAELKNLSPGTEYSYTLITDGLKTTGGSFYTKTRNDELKFLLLGDSQSIVAASAYPVFGKTLKNACAKFPDADFFTITGDLSDLGYNEHHWNAWFASASEVLNSLVFMPFTGNHETIGFKENGKPLYYTAQFGLPQNGPENFKELTYSFDCGPVHFSVLDSQDPEESFCPDMLNYQRDWLEKDLKKTDKNWKIVMFHKSPYPLRDRGTEAEQVRKAFCPVFDCYHVDLVINGHDHGIARTFVMKDEKPQKKPSSGTIYFISGRSGTKTYDKIEKKEAHAFFFNPLDQPCYSAVSISGKKLTVSSLKQDGTGIYEFTIDKVSDSVIEN